LDGLTTNGETFTNGKAKFQLGSNTNIGNRRDSIAYNAHDVRGEEMRLPEIGPGELLVKIEASGICGSDVMEWYRIQ